ncbi:hypothetical protein Mgra_00008286 [Meloidogyne graminicola]|uniref:EndoU domain-containing protein n=1 Tax=Meloidogyne graminicola TaxID=189291 RepID=A0A8S9ZG42_9BILA|nr:hypothetical protein Mgra_00008286 [Meloidogyne graminicola]
MVFYCSLLFISLLVVIAANYQNLQPLSILWKLDSQYRQKIGSQYWHQLETKKLLLILFLQILLMMLMCVYVDKYLRDEFLEEFNQSLIFQKAEELYKNEWKYKENKKSFLEEFKEILNFPEENPHKGIWHSYIRDQSKLKIFSLKNINNEQLIKDLQIKLWENGRMKKRKKFEIASLMLCAFLNREKGIIVLLLLMEIQSFYSRVIKQNRRKHKNDPELQELVTQLWEKDVDRIDESAIKLNWQGKLSKKEVKDISPDPLFTFVDEAIFNKPIYSALLEMYKEKVFYEQVCEAEPLMNQKRKEKFEKIWTLITESEVFKLGYEFIKKRGKTKHEIEKFCEEMFDFWFGTYSRCENGNEEPLGSSGFEHVFSGEWRSGNIVDGHHNWLRFYLQEKQGEINYHGYFIHQEDNILGTFQYKWKGFLKRIGGFFFRTSPAFDFTLFTVCALVHSGNEACQFELLNTKMFVTTFKMHCNNGTCLATSYPGLFD